MDTRRTITPLNSAIAVSDIEFTVSENGSAFARVRWAVVKSVHAYTRFVGKDVHLCLAFTIGKRNQDQVVVHEKVEGWRQLVEALPIYLGTINDRWEARARVEEAGNVLSAVGAVVSTYVVNPVQVWSSEAADA